MDILRITALWSGFTGAPGYSNFYFTTDGGFWDGGLLGDEAQLAAEGAADRVSAAFAMIDQNLPEGVTISIQDEAEILNSDTGEAIGFAEVSAASVNGAGPVGGYSAASGAVVNWRTNDYRGGRRIRGRTFIVPLSGDSYEDDGTLSTQARGFLQAFGNTMISGTGSADLGVWSRPIGGSGGVFATVTASNVPDMAAVLRSRRD